MMLGARATSRPSGWAALTLALMLPACSTSDSATPRDRSEASTPSAPAGDGPTLRPADFNLTAISALITEGEVDDMTALERAINGGGARISRVDLDGDGTPDPIRVTERRDKDGTRVFEFRAGAGDDAIAVAQLGFTVQGDKAIGEAIYTDAVEHHEGPAAEFEFKVKFRAGNLAVNNAFAAWVLAAKRPRYGSDDEARFKKVTIKQPKKRERDGDDDDDD